MGKNLGAGRNIRRAILTCASGAKSLGARESGPPEGRIPQIALHRCYTPPPGSTRFSAARQQPDAPPNTNNMKLIGSLASPFVRKVRIVATEKRVDYTFERADPWQPESAIGEHNPLGKVPVLVLEDGTALYDSRVIVEFLDAVSPIGRLIPADHRERTEVRRWEALADGVLDAGAAVRAERRRPAHEQSTAWVERQFGKVQRGLAVMDQELAGRTWCSGHSYSLADIAVGCCAGWLAFRFPELDWRTDCPDLARHYAKLADRSAFVATMPSD